MRVRRRGHHPTPAFGLNDGTFGRAIGEAYGASRICTFVRIDFDLVLRFQRHVDGIDVERAAGEIAHPALSTPIVINLESRTPRFFACYHCAFLPRQSLTLTGVLVASTVDARLSTKSLSSRKNIV